MATERMLRSRKWLSRWLGIRLRLTCIEWENLGGFFRGNRGPSRLSPGFLAACAIEFQRCTSATVGFRTDWMTRLISAWDTPAGFWYFFWENTNSTPPFSE